MDPVERERKLKEIAKEVSQCERCTLHYSRKNAVPGDGPCYAEILMIGEAPGFYENEQGRPFVGESGKLLDEFLASSGIERSSVFITNVIKSRPPGNRDPLPDELAACAPFLDRQIEIINPLVIVTLGRFSMARFFPDAKISEIHGKAKMVNGRMVVPFYHPAAALRQRSLKSTLERDFKKLPGLLEKARKNAPPEEENPSFASDSSARIEPANQLSLFSSEVSPDSDLVSPENDDTFGQLSLF